MNEKLVDSHSAEKNKKFPGPIAAGVFFSLTAILLTYGGIFLPIENDYLRSGLGEVLFVLVPALIFLIIGRYDIKNTLQLRRTKPINYLIVPLLMIFALPIVAVVNAMSLGIIRLVFGRTLPIEQLKVLDVPTLFIALLVVGVSAAVCEETLFRGLISKGYEKYGVIISLFITSILFGILHRDLQKSLGLILIGGLIGFIVYKTKSIYTGMVAHFTNNAIVVFMLFSTSGKLEEMEKLGITQLDNFDFSSIPRVILIISIIIYFMIFLGCTSVFAALMYAFCRVNKDEIISGNYTTISNYTGEDYISGSILQNDLEANSNGIGQAGYNSTQGDPAISEIEQTFIYDKASRKKLSLAGFISVLPGLILVFLIFAGQLLELLNVDSGMLYDLLEALWIIRPN
ncbi:CPBP family intramembrane metalloprotease [Ruminiclostridium herbifermentans]|uniref:CPBP family intramembrane metalloprotease n=1 Tax=Ruminiclostridium herbifermentans TaxID=2488810 RepID=A0A4U7JL20_9FIRM|nr:CPBP family intramembrane metalloprotease [Ruminiclostridium herbifermentans]